MNALRRSVGSLLAASMALALALGLTSEVRAGYYAYSVQQTSNYVFSGATAGTITPLSSSSGAQIGNPSGNESHAGGLDALQSFVGPGPRPAENTFTPLGQVNPDYVRGDALLTTSPSFTTNNVAEGFLNGPGTSAGSGSWAVSAPITLTAAGTVTLAFDYKHLLTLVNAPTATAPLGTVAADYGYQFSINTGGITLFSSSPNAVNTNLSLVAPGSSSTPGSGTVTITSGTLAAGTYTATISGSEHVFLNAVVPEPGSIALMTIGVGVLIGGAMRQRLARRRV